MTLEIDGAQSLDFQVVPKALGDAMLDRYVRTPGPCPALAPPVLDLTAERSARTQQPVPVPAGQYYLVLDNSTALGRTQPPPGAAGDHAVRADYVVLLGDRD